MQHTALEDLLFDEPGLGLCLVSPQGTVLRANAQWLRSAGLSCDEAQGLDLTERLAYSDTLRRALRQPASPSKCWEIPLHPRAEGGSKTWWTGRIAPLPMEGGTGLLLTLRKATACSRVEQAQCESEDRFRAFAETIPHLAFIADGEGRITYRNERMFRYFGIDKGAPELSWEGVPRHHPEDRARSLEAWSASMRTGQPLHIEYRLRRHDGQHRWYLTRALPVRDARGMIRLWVGTCTDLHDQREAAELLQRANEQLHEADRRKNEFLGMLSHELRNPLAPIRNSLFILDRSSPDEPQARRAKDILNRQVNHLTRLVDDLLDITRIVQGKIELRPERVELVELLRRTAEDHRSLMDERVIELMIQLPAEQLWMRCDATRLSQAIGNLLHNAAKFTPMGGKVQMSLSAAQGSAEIQVRDSGTGIAGELLGRIFEPFVQVKQTLARTEGGLGLGLALVKEFIELHGGEVLATSEGAGCGTAFTIRLPRLATEVAGDTTKDAPGHAPPRRRVLVVDDNRDAAESLAALVGFLGHEVSTAFDGFGALEQARATMPDIVLCDIGLPDMDGYQVARILRAQGHTRLQLIALSGYALPQDRQASAEAGFDCHIAKPACPAEIGRLLAAPFPTAASLP